jgi:phage host-nuclease inhibitor protein Gam
MQAESETIEGAPIEGDLAPPESTQVDDEVLRLVPAGFVIDDQTSANWLVRKIAEARRYAERVKEWAQREQRRAEREEQTLLFLFGHQIEAWTLDQIAALKGRRKSVNLPAGVVGFRKAQPTLRVDDEMAVIRWAKVSCPSAIVVVEKLSRTNLHDYFHKTGELPNAGAHVEQGGERFFIR